MLRKFAAALLATTLIAGPAFAASPTGNAGTPAAASAPAAPAAPTKTVKHARLHARHHVACGKVAGSKMSRLLKSAKTHRAHVAAPAVKPATVGKAAKNSAKTRA